MGSGRCAFKLIFERWPENEKIKRLWIPTYFCPEVVKSFEKYNLELISYNDSPLRDWPNFNEFDFKSGDALLLLNYFGLRNRPDLCIKQEIITIEDHSHDPLADWAINSKADWCIASLRKSFPLPDGAVLWSNKHYIDPEWSSFKSGEEHVHERVVNEKMAAMVLKKLYIQGDYENKPFFRKLFAKAESAIFVDNISPMATLSKILLGGISFYKWKEMKVKNFLCMQESLRGVPGCIVLAPFHVWQEGSSPFSVIIVFETRDICQCVFNKCLQEDIYPARLWPLDSVELPYVISGDEVDLSGRLLSIPCDMRYRAEDMLRVAELIKKVLGE